MGNTRYDRTAETTRRARELRRYVSNTESRLWPYLRSAQMGAPFRRQHPIGPYFADYCCVPLKLVIEVDGPTHDRRRDEQRDAVLAGEGYDVLRFTVEDVDERLTSVVDAIHSAVQLRLLARSVEGK